jgi:hypothetical protein
MSSQPNYSQYTLAELLEALESIDVEAFSDRAKQIVEMIKKRQGLSTDALRQAYLEEDNELAALVCSVLMGIIGLHASLSSNLPDQINKATSL